ncbi:DNA repair exonuclease SbcCD nuclease subunit [Natronobacillus azotifigens]|uniref:Metallophosphoesterase n=1 Tax=Natronobacillus azotifigens TaxID=472978 RepID=A0A9J6RD74_9BACI|nr:metallophosphoesterase [Natronobacillus azotifigens]MCZ0703318.1 metallophosphoesterase [Natronobacillus azotifigens]
MTEKIRFIHCADLHLDSPFKGLSDMPSELFEQVKKSTFVALHNLVDIAIKKQVDFVVVVGDIFDQTVQSVYAQIQFLHACQKLNDANIQVYISYGNHDYSQSNQKVIDYPNNVHVFSEENVTAKIFTKKSQDLAAIYGFSYPHRAVMNNKTAEYQKIANTPYHIGMLHGSVAQNTEHDHYAPFQVSELIEKPFDYWALGHIHKRMVLKKNPSIVYPGNLQGRSKKETGEKGCYYVELDKQETKRTFIPLQSVCFEVATLDMENCSTISDFRMKLNGLVEKMLSLYDKTIVTVKLTNFQQEVETWYYENMLQDVIDYTNERNNQATHWLWIQSITLSEYDQAKRQQQLTKEDPFIEQLLLTFQEGNIDEDLSPLWNHPQARKHLSLLTDEEKEELKKQAENLLIYQLVGKDSHEN